MRATVDGGTSSEIKMIRFRRLDATGCSRDRPVATEFRMKWVSCLLTRERERDRKRDIGTPNNTITSRR